ncbi:hypothetical protein H8S90_08935 [Olivibacter sp. SDN3]|uniref:lipocalin family protein n=1 Tax=Olivibacter sp. SDN3 TaxID=2764720 RepID=UPI001650F97C|nr:lipocalin family protein [Olivibacter sp. SDN3]QNL51677.1 hypothetical protein H8S90_08935 [Olivibacter sp. SDN3]
MKTFKSLIKMLIAIMVIAGVNLACSKDDDENNPETDPIIGTWNLRAVHDGEETVDVTDRECFRDSRFIIDETVMDLTLSVPDEDTEECQTETINGAWVRENGNYYLLNGEQRQQTGIVLNDDNQTLQMVITANGRQVGLIFRR